MNGMSPLKRIALVAHDSQKPALSASGVPDAVGMR